MKNIVFYSMKGCPHCNEMKEMMDNEKIPYLERDIDENKDEYDMFVEATDNEYIPSFMMFEVVGDGDFKNVKLIAPDRDFQILSEALSEIKKYLN